jgi:hypothetical protein
VGSIWILAVSEILGDLCIPSGILQLQRHLVKIGNWRRMAQYLIVFPSPELDPERTHRIHCTLNHKRTIIQNSSYLEDYETDYPLTVTSNPSTSGSFSQNVELQNLQWHAPTKQQRTTISPFLFSQHPFLALLPATLPLWLWCLLSLIPHPPCTVSPLYLIWFPSTSMVHPHQLIRHLW